MTNLKNLFCVLSVSLAFTAPSLAAGQDSFDKENRLKCNAETELPQSVTIDRAVDGDTVVIKVKGGTYSVRLLGIDTPETHYFGRSQGEWGERAAEFVAELLPVGTKVRVELGDTPCDGHGRLLGHVFKGKKHVNAELVRAGLAVNYCVYPSLAYCREFGAHVTAAMESRTGMFSDPRVELPYDFRRRVSGNEQRSFVGNLSTKEVFRPGHQNEVPVGERVFFYKERDVKPPFSIVE